MTRVSKASIEHANQNQRSAFAISMKPGLQNELLLPGAGSEPLPLHDADIELMRRVDLGQDYAALCSQLIDQTPWRQERIRIFGKTHPQPRLSAWYSDPGLEYRYSGIRLEPRPWSPLLSDIKARVEALAGAQFNSLLLNYYRDHRDSMGMHSDDETELGPQPTIASLSLGVERTLLLQHKTRKDRIKLPLASGSLLLMKGETQANWKHGIAKQTSPCGARLNLTFRYILKP